MTTTSFYDRRAERIAAQGLAAQQRAEADARRAQATLTLVQADQARAVTAAELADRRAQRRATEKQAGRDRRAASRALLAARVPGWLLSALWATVIVSPITLAWKAQESFAASTLHLGAWSWVFPLAVESGAWVCAFEAHHRGKRGLPIGSLLTWMWVLAGIAAAIQLLHGAADHGVVAGLCLAAMSLLGVLLHYVRHNADTAAAQGRSTADMRRGLLRWLRFPRLSLAAASVALARGADITTDEAWRAAWVDRYGVGPESSRRDRTVARVIVRHQRRADRTAAREGALTIVGGLILPVTVDLAQTVPAPVDTTVTAALPATVVEADTAIVQPKLSPKAAALLPKVRAAITAGDLPARPSARAILARFKGSTETAAEVRDALKTTQGVTR